MQIPVLTALIIIFIVWLQYEIRKSSKTHNNSSNNFWENEKKSNITRRGDISDLEYITVDLERLPMEDTVDDTINSYRDTIHKLSGEKIVNLTGLTNTQLKYQYGVININLLSEYDNNYTTLVSILQKWAERLYNRGFIPEAKAVLEYAVSIPTDVTKSYKLLAVLYKQENKPELIDDLIAIIPKTKVLRKDILIEELKTSKLF